MDAMRSANRGKTRMNPVPPMWRTARQERAALGRRAPGLDPRGRLLFVFALAAVATAALTVSAASAQTSMNFCVKKKKANKGLRDALPLVQGREKDQGLALLVS